MNERLVEDWLSKANERSFQTPFAQSLMAKGMQVLRLGHSPHEHGKDIIAVDQGGGVHAYQLKGGDLDIKDFENNFPQITALVETQVEDPSLRGNPQHNPYLVISGQASIPVLDRIRVHNITWEKRSFKPLQVINGRQLVSGFMEMSGNFWPQAPEDSRRFLTLYLADGKGNLDIDSFSKLIAGVADLNPRQPKTEVERRLASVNLFANYALSPFQVAANHWELVQGWTVTAAYIAWAADQAALGRKAWFSTFRLAVDAALEALNALAQESLLANALFPGPWELDELTRSRCTICAGAMAANILVQRKQGEPWELESAASELIKRMFTESRCVIWGESAVPFFLATMWAIDQLRGDQFGDQILLSALGTIAHTNSKVHGPKLPNPYDSADEANARFLDRLFKKHKAMDLQATASYTLAPLVMITARRLWRNALASLWYQITEVSLISAIPDAPIDLLLWRWEHQRGNQRSRLFGAPQSWHRLLEESRRPETESLPIVLREEFDFALLFLLCYPHRLTTALAKHFETTMSWM